MDSLEAKHQRLKEIIRSYDRLAIAFSGGVDSTLLLYVAHDVLGDNAVALSARVPMTPRSEADEAEAFCKANHIEQYWCEPAVLDVPEVKANDPKRCYYCKCLLFSSMKQRASELGFDVIADGSNLDDRSDYRPGAQALEELGVTSPLVEASLSKDEIRSLSHALSLPTWNKQSNACLATRFPYGRTLNDEKLRMVESAEQMLHDLGFDYVRVRVHDDTARVEIAPQQFSMLLDGPVRTKVSEYLHAAGFAYVALDLDGFRTGSMNRTLPQV